MRADTPPTRVEVINVETEVGPMLLGLTSEGLAWLSFGDERFGRGELERDLGCELGKATPELLEAFLSADSLAVRVHGTDFQVAVWRELLTIPAGSTRTYGTMATNLGNSHASRAVGAACGRNRVSLLIPCHRALGSTGKLVGFRWGQDVKAKLLAVESHDTLFA